MPKIPKKYVINLNVVTVIKWYNPLHSLILWSNFLVNPIIISEPAQLEILEFINQMILLYIMRKECGWGINE